MPLFQSKSKKAFGKNVESEMKSGKPQDQALAIAYSIKRRNERKKMADGGSPEEGQKHINEIIGWPAPSPSPKPSPKAYADGGDIETSMEYIHPLGPR